MDIAILGAGAIGSTFAFHLSRAGHRVTVVARGARLARLTQDGAIVRASGERAPVLVHGALDPTVDYDLLLVTVLAPQVAMVLPAVAASGARRVMFMFNTFEPIAPLATAVGADRFAFGFPMGVFTLLVDGVIHDQVRAGTTATDAALARTFSEAGIPTVVDDDMPSWLRSHAALVAPLMSIGVAVEAHGRGIGWGEAGRYATALAEGFALVRALGHDVRPRMVRAVAALPHALSTLVLWAMSRTRMLRDLGKLGATEPRMLIDQMAAAAGRSPVGTLIAIRP